jgi:hypothetical protein
MIRLLVLALCVSVVAVGLAGCGGGGSSAPTTATGHFVDAPVQGLTYETGGETRVTDADGMFTYTVGQPITFSIGGKVVLGSCEGKSVITPLDLAPDFDTATGIVQLLMGLDADSDPDTMQISSAVQTAAATLPITNVQELDGAALQSIVKSLDGSKDLASATDAENHLSGNLAKLFLGTWVQGDPTSNSCLAITFVDSTHYIGIENNPADGDGHPGIEMGSYTWDPKTGAFTAGAHTVDTNGDWGFDPGLSTTASISGNVLTLLGPDDPTFAKLASDPTKPLVGAWLSQDAQNTILLIFRADGTFLMAEHHAIVDPGCSDGLETGTYSWNATTGAMTVHVVADTNGDWGFSDAGAVTVTVAGKTLTWNGTNTATRIGE